MEPRRTRSHAKGGWKIVIGLPVLGALSDPGGFNPIEAKLRIVEPRRAQRHAKKG
ncbi:MAG: hypothetical protein R6V27_02640 [Balneolaceae bacterium]